MIHSASLYILHQFEFENRSDFKSCHYGHVYTFISSVVSENTEEKSNEDPVATQSTNKGDKWPLLDEELVQRFGPLFVPKVATPHNINSHSAGISYI